MLPQYAQAQHETLSNMFERDLNSLRLTKIVLQIVVTKQLNKKKFKQNWKEKRMIKKETSEAQQNIVGVENRA